MAHWTQNNVFNVSLASEASRNDLEGFPTSTKTAPVRVTKKRKILNFHDFSHVGPELYTANTRKRWKSTRMSFEIALYTVLRCLLAFVWTSDWFSDEILRFCSPLCDPHRPHVWGTPTSSGNVLCMRLMPHWTQNNVFNVSLASKASRNDLEGFPTSTKTAPARVTKKWKILNFHDFSHVVPELCTANTRKRWESTPCHSKMLSTRFYAVCLRLWELLIDFQTKFDVLFTLVWPSPDPCLGDSNFVGKCALHALDASLNAEQRF